MEIVINKDYGGFGLSKEAVEMYLKLKGKECFCYTYKSLSDFKNTSFIKIDKESNIITHYVTKDLGNETKELPKEHYFSDREIERNDKDLVKVVKELGDKANGKFSNLAIVEIPDGVEYTIEEYDGLEHIAEKHRTWG